MTTTRLGSIEVEQCQTCKGLWFQDEELRLAKDETDQDLAWLDFDIWKHRDRFKAEPRHLVCPTCGTALMDVQYGETPVSVDCCPTCHGVWLDKGKFGSVINALEDEVTTKDAAGYVKASLAQAKELFTGPETFLSEWRDLRSVLRLLQFRFFIEHQGLTKFLTRIPRLP